MSWSRAGTDTCNHANTVVEHNAPFRSGVACQCKECLAKNHSLEQTRSSSKHFSLRNIVFVAGWLLLIVLFLRMPEMQSQVGAQRCAGCVIIFSRFAPVLRVYRTLRSSSRTRCSASSPAPPNRKSKWCVPCACAHALCHCAHSLLRVCHCAHCVHTIVQAYRRMAVKLHPDKNRDDPDAEKKFILLAKAHAVLTDPTAKVRLRARLCLCSGPKFALFPFIQENMEKYGNPDGYKGMSFTIGLPSMLTKRENQLPVLILYFLLIIVSPWFSSSLGMDTH